MAEVGDLAYGDHCGPGTLMDALTAHLQRKQAGA
jgi:hypothetical protein